jgi:hypothetical protein
LEERSSDYGVTDAVRRLASAGLVRPNELRGCSEEDVRELEAATGVRLPASYRAFLQVMGRSAGDFFDGTDVLFPALLTLREDAEFLLQRCNAAVRLLPNDFVFAVHQGYTFLFLRTDGTDDPPVYVYLEDDPEFRKAGDSFSSWLRGAVQDEIGASAKLSEITSRLRDRS